VELTANPARSMMTNQSNQFLDTIGREEPSLEGMCDAHELFVTCFFFIRGVFIYFNATGHSFSWVKLIPGCTTRWRASSVRQVACKMRRSLHPVPESSTWYQSPLHLVSESSTWYQSPLHLVPESSTWYQNPPPGTRVLYLVPESSIWYQTTFTGPTRDIETMRQKYIYNKSIDIAHMVY